MTDSSSSKPLLTIGDLSRLPSLKSFSRRQLEYAIQEGRVEPAMYAGIIRLFALHQIPELEAVLHRTARRRCHQSMEVNKGAENNET